MKILLLEDDIILCEIIEEYINELGYEVSVCYDGTQAESLIYEQIFDIFIFDINVPYIDGLELLRNARESNIKTPTIMITSRNTSSDLESGFKAGADDYIKKPFELKELELRINNIKRIYKLDNLDTIQIIDGLLFNAQTNEIHKNDTRVSITKKESDILKYLLNHSNQAVSVDELSTNIWGYDNCPSNATIRTYIKNIRKSLGQDIITNIKGVGYKINTT